MQEVMSEDIAEEIAKKEKKDNLKALSKYQVSEEFKDVLAFCSEAKDSLLDDLQESLKGRLECELKYSQVTERQMYVGVLERVLEKIGCPQFKDYLNERRVAHVSFIENRAGVDEPIYSELDLIKFQRQEYHNIETYLQFAIDKNKEIKEVETDDSAY